MRASTWRRVILLLVVTVLALPMAAGCGDAEPEPAADTGKSGGNSGPVEPLTDDAMDLAAGGNRFAFDMYGRLAGDGNLFFSPYSISTALGMTAAGARGNTEYEMATALRFPTDPKAEGLPVYIGRERVASAFGLLQRSYAASPETDGYELNVANSLWGQDGYPFKQDYLSFVDDNFAGGFNLADFEGNTEAERVRINAWVESETRERIKDLIPQGGVDMATTLVLTNAVYFKGDWASQFETANTATAPFHGEHGDADVSLMYQKAEFDYFENDVVQVLEMPYVGEKISMLVLLPRVENVRNLAMLEAGLTPEMFDDLAESTRKKEVKVFLPKFEMTWGTEDVSGHLAALGMHDAFSSRADFSGMTDQGDLYIGPVFHKAFVAVDEEGTEAAAATAVVMKRAAIEPETVFRADHPFMFVIRDNPTGGILFMGRVADLD